MMLDHVSFISKDDLRYIWYILRKEKRDENKTVCINYILINSFSAFNSDNDQIYDLRYTLLHVNYNGLIIIIRYFIQRYYK